MPFRGRNLPESKINIKWKVKLTYLNDSERSATPNKSEKSVLLNATNLNVTYLTVTMGIFQLNENMPKKLQKKKKKVNIKGNVKLVLLF